MIWVVAKAVMANDDGAAGVTLAIVLSFIVGSVLYAILYRVKVTDHSLAVVPQAV